MSSAQNFIHPSTKGGSDLWERPLGYTRAVLSLDRNEQILPSSIQNLSPKIHTNSLCIHQSLSPSFYASVPTGSGGKVKGTKSGIIAGTNHNVPKKSMTTESYKISTQVRYPGSYVALTAKLWIPLPLAEFEQTVSKNVNEGKWAWYVQRQGLRNESRSLYLKGTEGGHWPVISENLLLATYFSILLGF